MKNYAARFSVESCCCGMRLGETLLNISAKNKKEAKKLANSKEGERMMGGFRLRYCLEISRR